MIALFQVQPQTFPPHWWILQMRLHVTLLHWVTVSAPDNPQCCCYSGELFNSIFSHWLSPIKPPITLLHLCEKALKLLELWYSSTRTVSQDHLVDQLLLFSIDLWKYKIYLLCLLLMQILFFKSAIFRRGMREMVKVVLWYIYSCQSATSWDWDKINSWDVASYHLQYQGAHTPVMQAIQFYLIYPKPIQAVSQH